MENVDKALDQLSEDALDREKIVSVLASALVQDGDGGTRATGRVVGLTGQWGSGKSTILNFLEENLRDNPNTFVVRFNPWIVSGSEQLIDVYFKELTHQLGRSKKEKARELAMKLEDYRDGITKVAEFVFPHAGVFNSIIPRIKDASIQEKRDNLERKLREFDGAVVVIIDELDRVEDRDIRELARFVKAVGDLPGISYMVGYDHVRVQRALARGMEVNEGEEYLKKIVQVNIPIRPMMDYEVENLLRKYLDPEFLDCLSGVGSEFDDVMEEVIYVIDTPRDVKRFCSTANSYWNGAGNEVHPCDIFLFSAIASASSDLRSFLTERMQEVVIDPTDAKVALRDVFRERSKEDRLEQMGFESIRFARYEDIIKQLFPRLGSREYSSDFGRVSNIQNLLKLIYFGDPPFRISRSEVFDLWNSPTFENFQEVLTARKSQQLPDRIEKLLKVLPWEKDIAFFNGFSNFVLSFDTEERVGFRGVVDGIKWALIRLISNDVELLLRVHELIGALVDEGDTILLPDLVRHHMFAFGLAQGFEKRDYAVVVQQDEFVDIHQRTIKRYASLILNGEWESKFCTADPFFAVEQSGEYSEEIRQAVSQQVEDPGSALAFCMIIAPPGVSIERSSLERLVDLEHLSSGIEKLHGGSRTSDAALATIRHALT